MNPSVQVEILNIDRKLAFMHGVMQLIKTYNNENSLHPLPDRDIARSLHFLADTIEAELDEQFEDYE